MSRRGLCLVIAGPSGAGKTSIAEALLATDPGLRRSVSATTRQPRAGEVDGHDYYFLSQADFDDLVAAGGMLEHATVFGRSYGIPRAPVVSALERGVDVVFVIDWQGHRTLQEKLLGDVLGVFIMPPSMADLETRLRARGDDDDQIARRMAEAVGEMGHAPEFDHVVVNDRLSASVASARAILERARQIRAVGEHHVRGADRRTRKDLR